MEDKDVTDNEHDKGNVSETRCSLEGEKTTRKRGIETTDISPFCDQLEKFIKYIGNFRDLNFLTYNYPNVLENRLDGDVRELESMLAEVKDAIVRVERVKMQRRSIKKEKIAVTRTLKRMRDDEIREMECVISLYDKPMFSRWENVRDTHNPEILEGMLMDIQGKQLAFENLKILATRKLGQIQTFKPRLGTDTEKGCAGVREKSVIALPFPSFCPSLPPLPPPAPPPPPLPPPLPLASNLPKRSHTQRLSMQRRRRLERRDENLERRCVVTANVDDFSLVPLTLSDLPANLTSNLYPTILSSSRNSSHDVISEDSVYPTDPRIGTTDVTLLNRINNNSDDDNGVQGLGLEFQSEMRTVLQALFGDLRSAPTLLVTDTISTNAEEDENASNANREIELYTLRKT